MEAVSNLCVRRLPGEDGKLLTYLPIRQIVELVGISRATARRWATAGAVRALGRINGDGTYLCVSDAARLKLMDRKETQEAGIYRTPNVERVGSHRWYETTQEATKPAENNGEEWDDYDLLAVMVGIEEGKSLSEIAADIGRTYAATSGAVRRLRESGDLPPFSDDDSDWWWRTRAVLSRDEQEALETREIEFIELAVAA
jgi:hypothetical protein